MYSAPPVFTPVMDFMWLKSFRRRMEMYQGNISVETFTCLDQFFARLTYRERLRDIEVCLRAHNNKLFFRGMLSSKLPYCFFVFLRRSTRRKADYV